MNTVLRLVVVCDWCGAVHDRGDDTKAQMVGSAREEAAKDGWSYIPALCGADKCPDCDGIYIVRGGP